VMTVAVVIVAGHAELIRRGRVERPAMGQDH
jgi:hypothetical protein